MNRSIFHVMCAGGLVAAALAVNACQQTPMNRGQSGYRMDPTSDSPAEYGSQSPRSADLINATDKMAADLASRVDITDPDSPPKIFVGNIENKTSLPHKNFQVFLVRLRAQLQKSGARHGLEFIREREAVEEYRQEEYGGKDPQSTAAAYRSRADYVLTAEMYDLPSGGTNYFLVDYQLIQLRDADTGPDVGSGSIVWENAYEVKFQ